MSESKVVLPGEFIEEKKGRKIGKNTFSEDEKVFSKLLGIKRVDENEINVIPLSGVYMPNFGDKIVGLISSTEVSGWFVDINSPYEAFLPLSEGVDAFVDNRVDISKFHDVGNVIFCKISRVTKGKNVQVTMRDISCRNLFGGIIIKVTPSKVPRIIGKAGSMIQLIKSATKTEIYVGQNGLVWIKGEDKAKAIEAILKIEKESHTSGLTEKIEKLLGEKIVKES